MCNDHTHGSTKAETPVSEVKNPTVLAGAKELAGKEITGTLKDEPVITMLLGNDSKRRHFEGLHNGEEKLKYISRLMTEHYAGGISAAYQAGNIVEAQRLEKLMTENMRAVSQLIFKPTPPAKA